MLLRVPGEALGKDLGEENSSIEDVQLIELAPLIAHQFEAVFLKSCCEAALGLPPKNLHL
jgi:hypothetical protein